MKTEHTPEPWFWNEKYGEVCFRSKEDDQSYGMACPVDLTEEANARRIVACVNACAGIPTDDLEMSPVFLYTSDQLAAAQGENERLRIALGCTKRDLIRMRCPDFFEGVKDGYENLFDGHLVSMIGLINDYAKQK